MSTSWDWIHEALSPGAIALWMEIDWANAVCLDHWLPTAAWMNEGWGDPPRFNERSDLGDMWRVGLEMGVPLTRDPLELAARIHWADMAEDPLRMGRRSPGHVLATRLCWECALRPQCYEYAVVAFEPGTWGGTSERARRAERSRRRRARHHRS